jgi:biotin operon repressor
VLKAIETAEKEQRDWTYASIAEEVSMSRTGVYQCVLQLRVKGLLVEGARQVVRMGLVIRQLPTEG